MDWLDIRNNGKVNVITEQVYRGIQCTWVENKGWKITLGDSEYLFPTFQDARQAIRQIHEACVDQFGGIKLKFKSPQ